MKNPFPIMWHEGMPLNAVNFQQDFLFNQEHLKFLFQNLTPNNWGITHLKLETLHLHEGIFKIEEIECIMPDFSKISFPQTSADNLEIDLNEYKEQLKKNDLFIYLTIPQNHQTHSANEFKARYTVHNKEVSDFNEPESNYNTSFLKPNCSLIAAKTPPMRTVAMPIAKIKFNGMNFEMLDYIAPITKISNSQLITESIKKIIIIGRDKLNYINSDIDNSANQSVMLSAIASIVFNMEFALKGNIDPFTLFQILSSCFANMLIVNKLENIPTIPDYDHTNIASSIINMLNFISSSLSTVKESYKLIKFNEHDGMFGINIKDEKKIIIGIKKASSSSIESIIKWIENALITTEDKIDIMQDQRTIGTQRKVIGYSQELNLKATSELLLVEVILEKSAITPNKMLCIMNFDEENKPEEILIFETK